MKKTDDGMSVEGFFTLLAFLWIIKMFLTREERAGQDRISTSPTTEVVQKHHLQTWFAEEPTAGDVLDKVATTLFKKR